MKLFFTQLLVEQGHTIKDANPLDLAALVKQFFRELPDPLLTSRHHDTFLLAYGLEDEGVRESAILLICLLLPTHHLSALRFFMMFLRRISAKAVENKMGVQVKPENPGLSLLTCYPSLLCRVSLVLLTEDRLISS